MNLYIEIKTIEQWQTVSEWMNGCSYDIDLNLIVDISIADKADPGRCRLWLSLPEVARENCVDALGLKDFINRKEFSGVIAKNLDELGMLKSTGYAGDIIGDSFLYAYNKDALDMYGQLFPEMKFMAADELTDKELETLAESREEKFIYKIYGCQRLMTTAQDTGAGLSPHAIRSGPEPPARDTGAAPYQALPPLRRAAASLDAGAALKFSCSTDRAGTTAENTGAVPAALHPAGQINTTSQQNTGAALLENIKGDQFAAEYDHTWKYSVICTKKPVFMMDSVNARKWRDLLVSFTVEDKKETEQVLSMLDEFLRGEDIKMPQGFEYTRGHHVLGIE